MRLPRSTPWLLLVSALAVPRPALAQGASSQAAAQELFDAGRKLMDAGKYAEACPKLAASAKLDPGPGTLLNLASCYEKNGQTASAWVTYKDAATAATASGRKDWAQKAQQKGQALEGKLSRLRIDATPAGPADLEVRRDGALVAAAELGLGIPVDPGAREVTASAPHYKAWSTTVDVPSGGGSVTVTIPALEREPDVAPPPTAAPTSAPVPPQAGAASEGDTQRMVGLGLLGLGVVSAGVGGFFGLRARSQHDDALDNHCRTATVCTQAGADLVDDAKGSATLSTALFALGGAALAGGAIVYLTAPKRPVTAEIVAGPAAAAVVVKGAF